MRFVLTLLRHGTAEDPGPQGDHERRLTAYGVSQARVAAEGLWRAGVKPTLILVSDAKRTLTTAAEFTSAWLKLGGPALTPQVEPELYLGGLRDVIRLVAANGQGHQSILVVGHNPTLSELATTLTESDICLGTAESAVLTMEEGEWDVALPQRGAWTVV